MYKTFARKYKSSIGKIKGKYCINGIFTVKYQTKHGEKAAAFYNKGFKRNMDVGNADVDLYAMVQKYGGRNSLKERMRNNKCEWCGAEDVPIEMHHVRKLKNLKGKKNWEKQMIARKRKTLALCKNCHTALHSGKLD